MNLFQLSYDVAESGGMTNEQALAQLVEVLVRRLHCPMISRFVRSTVVFSTASGYFDTLQVLNGWLSASGITYVVAQILPNEDGKRFYYMVKPNQSLQNEVNILIRMFSGQGNV